MLIFLFLLARCVNEPDLLFILNESSQVFILRPIVNKVVMNNLGAAQQRVSQHFERRRMVPTSERSCAMHAAGCDAVSISLDA